MRNFNINNIIPRAKEELKAHFTTIVALSVLGFSIGLIAAYINADEIYLPTKEILIETKSTTENDDFLSYEVFESNNANLKEED